MSPIPPRDDDARPGEIPPPGPLADSEVRVDPTPVVIAQREQLIAAARAVTGMDRHSAEDVVSIVTERVLRKGTVPRAAEAWLTYMHQAVVREARREAQRASQTVALDGDELSGVDPAIDRVAARIQWLDAMHDLRVLPDDERQVFVLRHYDALTYAQIAETTGLPEDGVDNRLRRATKRLAQRRAEREASGAYLLLALFSRSARRTSVTGPPTVVAAAGTLALSMLAVLAVPTPHAVRADTRPVPAEWSVAPGSDARTTPAGTSRDAGQSMDARAAFPLAASRPAPRPGARTPLGRVVVEACVGTTCIAARDDANRLRGDVITISRLPGVRVSQQTVPLCRDVPANPELGCDEDDRGHYQLHRPEQEPRHEGWKSNPSAPTQEPPKGPHP